MKSDKYLIFKNKMRSLLLKQNVNIAMDRAYEVLQTDPNEEQEVINSLPRIPSL